jgi:hypothetical protein
MTTPTTSAASAPIMDSPVVLLVDDQMIIGEAVRRILPVVVVSSKEEAITKAEALPAAPTSTARVQSRLSSSRDSAPRRTVRG